MIRKLKGTNFKIRVAEPNITEEDASERILG